MSKLEKLYELMKDGSFFQSNPQWPLRFEVRQIENETEDEIFARIRAAVLEIEPCNRCAILDSYVSEEDQARIFGKD